MPQEILIVIPDARPTGKTRNELTVIDLAEFLFEFDYAYNAFSEPRVLERSGIKYEQFTIDSHRIFNIAHIQTTREKLIPLLRESMFYRFVTEDVGDDLTELKTRARTPISEVPLSVVSIKKQSPLEIVIWAIPAALTAAVILSGGKVKYNGKSGIEAELPPIGEGIKLLKEALFGDSDSKSDDDSNKKD